MDVKKCDKWDELRKMYQKPRNTAKYPRPTFHDSRPTSSQKGLFRPTFLAVRGLKTRF
jgi:hypothetical protein